MKGRKNRGLNLIDALIILVLLLGAAGMLVRFYMTHRSGADTVAAVRFVIAEADPALFTAMAAGGDLGGSLGPQLVGSVTDTVVASDTARKLAVKWGIGAESLGLRVGFLVGTLFPILSIVVYANLLKRKNRRVKKEEESEVD